MRLLLLLLFICVYFGVTHAAVPPSTLPYSCDSKIYCQGELLDMVQMAQLYPDSKSFVDMKMITNEATVLQNFNKFRRDFPSPTKVEIQKFVNDSFELGNELEEWIPSDLSENPPFLMKITDERMKTFAKQLNAIWPLLARKIKVDVKDHKDQYSIIPVPNGFIVPGGRFREFYYWDTYWIIEGLLVTGMTETARGMLDNFIYMVNQYGFVPNGGRVYYLQRSQPPLLTPMAMQYFKATNDIAWVKNNVKALEKELNHWYKTKTVTITRYGLKYRMARYMPESLGPRPESYREDVNTASVFTTPDRRQEAYVDLKGGAESGWDYSSRWLFDTNGKPAYGNLTNIHTRRVIPVDLNSYLYRAYSELAILFQKVNKHPEHLLWKGRAADLRNAIYAVHWNKKEGVWFDYDLESGEQRNQFLVSNLAPLWAGVAFDRVTGDLVMNYLDRTKVFDNLGGTPTSLVLSGEQWDFPNAWPPLQDIIVTGLQNIHSVRAQNKAKELAGRWLDANIIGFKQTSEMFEKYDAVVPGRYGGGGEYNVQSGFGWSNGVALKFIKKYYTK